MNRRKIIIFLFVIVCAVLGCSCMVNAGEEQKVYYVSSSLGDDENDGSENRPFKTIACPKIPREGVTIKLKCGDYFYENVVLKGNNMTSYGEGPKPVVCGWKYLPKSKALWSEGMLKDGNWIKKKGTCVWRLDMTQDGFWGRTSVQEKYINNVGLIMDVENNIMHGHKCEFLYKYECNDPNIHAQRNTYLQKNFDFAQTSHYGKGKIKESDYNYLYMYLDHDPSIYNLKFSTYGFGINTKDATITNIRVEGFSAHGFTCGSNVTISQCEVDYVGGGQQTTYLRWARYGNGIEFYISKKSENSHVFNNKISHTFDCATTIQGEGRIGAYPSNIIIENNLIINCRQAFEYFLNNYDKEKNINYDCEKCYFRNNICINSGENGFDSPEMRDTHILSYQRRYTSSMIIENNVFIGGKGFYTSSNPDLLKFGGNECYYTEPFVFWTSGKKEEEEKNKNQRKSSLKKGDMHFKDVEFKKLRHDQLDQMIQSYK